MVPREVIAYVQRLRNSGYSAQAIRQNLIASGYTPQEADQALLSGFRPMVMQQGRNWKPLAAGIGAGTLVLVLMIVLLVPSGPAFTVSTQPSSAEARAGSSISFSERFVYERELDTDELEVIHELVAPATGNLIFSVDQRIPISPAYQTKLEIPEDLQPGRYIVRTIVTADGHTAESSFSFRVLPPAPRQTVQVPTVPVVETPVDNQAEEMPAQDCNDFDPCTDDSFFGGQCVFEQLPVCCGDYICDFNLGETTTTCPRDCAAQPAAKSTAEIIAEAEQAAVRAPETAELLCTTLAQKTDADQCYDTVARIGSKSATCQKISDSKTRDKCVLYFAIHKSEYTGCATIGDPNLQSSCYSFKNLGEIQQNLPQAPAE